MITQLFSRLGHEAGWKRRRDSFLSCIYDHLTGQAIETNPKRVYGKTNRLPRSMVRTSSPQPISNGSCLTIHNLKLPIRGGSYKEGSLADPGQTAGDGVPPLTLRFALVSSPVTESIVIAQYCYNFYLVWGRFCLVQTMWFVFTKLL